jgi:tRNA(fMet)-specific endonuclease VapC
MSGRYLLDTNVAIHVLNRELEFDSGIESFLCVTVAGELLFGAANSDRAEVNRQRVEWLLEVCPLLPHGLETAKHYGELKTKLQQQGRPIPENDIWIAASALEHRLTLVTRDRHFDQVANLPVERW